MLRLLLPLLVMAAFPTAAHASVLSAVSGDTLTITGDAAPDHVTLRLSGPEVLAVDDGASVRSFDRSTFSKIAIKSGAGADEVRVEALLRETTTIDAGLGADVVIGGPGAEVISGGDDADLVLAGPGDDTVFLGAGDDTAIHAGGDGADKIDGQSGNDTLQENGSGESEEFTVQAVGAVARVSRDTAFAPADTTAVEVLALAAGGERDLVDVGDLTGTSLARVDADLGLADGAPDSVFLAGTDGGDKLQAATNGDTVTVSGELRVENAGANDRLTVFGFGGSDTLTAIGAVGEHLGLTLDGGDGNDTITGAAAGEVLRGGAGADTVRGNGGDDTIELGDGADTAVWRPLDGHDTISGDAGEDRLLAQGSSADEAIDVSAGAVSGGAARAGLSGVETVAPAPGSGTDIVSVQDLTGSAIKTVDVDLGAPDQRLDTLTVAGTPGDDSIKVAASGTDAHAVTGLAATVIMRSTDPGQKLAIGGGEGNDTIDASAMIKDKTQPFLFGAGGKDLIVGSPGQDVITGGTGVDVALLGGGLDTFNWSVGDGSDIVEGGAGTDFLHMDGGTANERFTVSPVGGRTTVNVDVGNVRADLGDVERLDILPGGGADTMRVDDLSGTDTDHVDFDLALGRATTASDKAADSVTVNGTFGNDVISVAAGGPEVRETGLAAIVTTRFSDPTLDSLHIDTKAGNDLVSVGATVHQLLKFSSV